MAKSRMTWGQRQELHSILHWLEQPVSDPIQYMIKVAVRSFLNGEDPQLKLEAQGAQPFVVKRACDLARVWIGNERARRRMRSQEILDNRAKYKKHEFTHENFRVKMDLSQDRNYGMVNVSIYAYVEVWIDDETVEKEYLINFSDYKTKEWLTRLMVWALMNKREVLIKPATEEIMASVKMFIPKEKLSA